MQNPDVAYKIENEIKKKLGMKVSEPEKGQENRPQVDKNIIEKELGRKENSRREKSKSRKLISDELGELDIE